MLGEPAFDLSRCLGSPLILSFQATWFFLVLLVFKSSLALLPVFLHHIDSLSASHARLRTLEPCKDIMIFCLPLNSSAIHVFSLQ